MRDMLKLALKLFLVCVVAAGLLGLTNSITKGPIEEQKVAASLAANKAVCTEATTFEEMNLDELKADAAWTDDFNTITAVLAGKNDAKETIGYAIKVTASGYNGDVNMTVGVGLDGTYSGMSIDYQNETAGLGANVVKEDFRDQYAGKATSTELSVSKTGPSDTEIQALAGATITSKAATKAVNVVGRFANAFSLGE